MENKEDTSLEDILHYAQEISPQLLNMFYLIQDKVDIQMLQDYLNYLKAGRTPSKLPRDYILRTMRCPTFAITTKRNVIKRDNTLEHLPLKLLKVSTSPFEIFKLRKEFELSGIVNSTALLHFSEPTTIGYEPIVNVLTGVPMVNPFADRLYPLEYGTEISLNYSNDFWDLAYTYTPLLYSEKTECIIFLEKEYQEDNLRECRIMCVGETASFNDAVGYPVNYEKLKEAGGVPNIDVLRELGLMYWQ